MSEKTVFRWWADAFDPIPLGAWHPLKKTLRYRRMWSLHSEAQVANPVRRVWRARRSGLHLCQNTRLPLMSLPAIRPLVILLPLQVRARATVARIAVGRRVSLSCRLWRRSRGAAFLRDARRGVRRHLDGCPWCPSQPGSARQIARLRSAATVVAGSGGARGSSTGVIAVFHPARGEGRGSRQRVLPRFAPTRLSRRRCRPCRSHLPAPGHYLAQPQKAGGAAVRHGRPDALSWRLSWPPPAARLRRRARSRALVEIEPFRLVLARLARYARLPRPPRTGQGPGAEESWPAASISAAGDAAMLMNPRPIPKTGAAWPRPVYPRALAHADHSCRVGPDEADDARRLGAEYGVSMTPRANVRGGERGALFLSAGPRSTPERRTSGSRSWPRSARSFNPS